MFKHYIEDAYQAALLASQEIMAIYQTDFSFVTKDDHSPVTIADQKADVIIRKYLKSKYPNFGDLLFNEKLYKVLPGLPNIKCGIVLYDRIYKDFNEIKEHGTLAIQLKVI